MMTEPLLSEPLSTIQHCTASLDNYAKKSALGQTPGEIAASVWYFGHILHHLENLVQHTNGLNIDKTAIHQIKELKQTNAEMINTLQINEEARQKIHHCVQKLNCLAMM